MTVTTLLVQLTPPDAVDAWRLGIGLGQLLRAGALVLLGFPILFALSGWARRGIGRRYAPQHGLIAGKLVFYPGVVVLTISILSELGFGLAPLLGAAGIVGIAIGFASQTSVSNVISGLFLIAERPFQVDDVIQVGDTTGRVLSIDTLSVKLRTFDNRFVRIPNETIVKSQVTTVTRFPIRRLDLQVGVAYRSDVPTVRRALLEAAARNPRALMEPAPQVFFEGYADSAMEFRLAVWVVRERFLELKNSLLEEIRIRFEEEGIEIPFPHRTLHAGEGSVPFPVRVVTETPTPPAPPDSPESADREGASGNAGAGGGRSDPLTSAPPTDLGKGSE